MLQHLKQLFRPAQRVELVTPATDARGAPPRLGTTELLRAYSTMPWLRAVTHKVGRAVGETEWQLHVQRAGRGGTAVLNQKAQRARFSSRKAQLDRLQKQGNLAEITQHPLLDLLATPNTQMSGMAFFQLTQLYMDLVGEAFWVMERNALGTPAQLWPLPPNWVRALPAHDRQSYIVQLGALEHAIAASEVIAFRDLDPADPFKRGTGIAKALGDELETDEWAAKHLKAFFHNRARPDLVISGGDLHPEATKRMEEQWVQKHAGFWRAYKPQFLARKVDITQLGQSFENMQLVQLRQYERDMVIQVFGAPPEKFGLINESKRATISAADLFWTKDVIVPRVELLRGAIQERLVPLYDTRLVLDYVSPVPADQDHRLKVMRSAPWAYTRNEWREEAGFEDLGTDGETFQVPVNTQEQPK